MGFGEDRHIHPAVSAFFEKAGGSPETFHHRLLRTNHLLGILTLRQGQAESTVAAPFPHAGSDEVPEPAQAEEGFALSSQGGSQLAKEDIENEVEDPEYLTVMTGDIHRLAIKALQEAMEKIETLEAKVKALEDA